MSTLGYVTKSCLDDLKVSYLQPTVSKMFQNIAVFKFNSFAVYAARADLFYFAWDCSLKITLLSR